MINGGSEMRLYTNQEQTEILERLKEFELV